MERPISPNRIDHHDGGNEQQQQDREFSEAAGFVWVAHERSLPPAIIPTGRNLNRNWVQLKAGRFIEDDLKRAI
jgi:hypothetical protein